MTLVLGVSLNTGAVPPHLHVKATMTSVVGNVRVSAVGAHEKAGWLSMNGGQKQGKVSCKGQALHDTMMKFMETFYS